MATTETLPTLPEYSKPSRSEPVALKGFGRVGESWEGFVY